MIWVGIARSESQDVVSTGEPLVAIEVVEGAVHSVCYVLRYQRTQVEKSTQKLTRTLEWDVLTVQSDDGSIIGRCARNRVSQQPSGIAAIGVELNIEWSLSKVIPICIIYLLSIINSINTKKQKRRGDVPGVLLNYQS